MKKAIPVFAFAILAAATAVTLSNSWIVPGINLWQTKLVGDNSYFPALTIFILALPPLLLLLAIKWWVQKRSL